MNNTKAFSVVEREAKAIVETMRRKNHDYATAGDESADFLANFRQSEAFGVDPLAGLMVRMGDKIQRLATFVKAGKLEVKNEGADDALRDIMGYALIGIVMMEEKRKPADCYSPVERRHRYLIESGVIDKLDDLYRGGYRWLTQSPRGEIFASMSKPVVLNGRLGWTASAAYWKVVGEAEPAESWKDSLYEIMAPKTEVPQ